MRLALLGVFLGFNAYCVGVFAVEDICEERARARLREHFPVFLEQPALIKEVERGQLKIVFGENYCIYTAFFADETCEKIVRTRQQCI